MRHHAPHVTHAEWHAAWQDVRQHRAAHEMPWFMLRHPVAGRLAYVAHTMRAFVASPCFGPVSKLP